MDTLASEVSIRTSHRCYRAAKVDQLLVAELSTVEDRSSLYLIWRTRV